MRCEREGVDGAHCTVLGTVYVWVWVGMGVFGCVRGCLQYLVHCTLLGPGTVRVCVWVCGCGCGCACVCMRECLQCLIVCQCCNSIGPARKRRDCV